MYAKLDSISVLGVEGVLVEVEVYIGNGMPNYVTVGLPDAAVRESRDRIKSSLTNNHYQVDLEHVTVNLAPAELRKEGAIYDLPIALGVLISNNVIMGTMENDFLIVGELALDGRVRPCRGILCAALKARELGKRGIIIPFENAAEASVVKGIDIYPVKTLSEAIQVIQGFGGKMDDNFINDEVEGDYQSSLDFVDIKGQELAKRAIMVAAAGGHNLIMVGPPGSGKSMIAKRLPGILPGMTQEEAIETTKIHSIAGSLEQVRGLIRERPFRSPHHTISNVGLIGGGSTPRPGEVSLSHNGVLFLDELPEFNRKVLEVLRQPLEDGKVSIVRASSSVVFPSDLMLVAAMNPCPCGYFGYSQKRCKCSTVTVQKYMGKISGPLMDRIDIQIEVQGVDFKDVTSKERGLSSREMKERVRRARQIQRERFSGTKIYSNSYMNEKMLTKYCQLDENGTSILEMGMSQMGFSARAYSRILKVARTIADMGGSEKIESVHITEALNYRCMDKLVG